MDGTSRPRHLDVAVRSGASTEIGPIGLEVSQARAAAERALTIDPQCGEAHKALYLLAPPAAHFREIEKQLLSACEATPTNGEVRWALFQLYLAVGRVREADVHGELAYRVDNASWPDCAAEVAPYDDLVQVANRTRLEPTCQESTGDCAGRGSTSEQQATVVNGWSRIDVRVTALSRRRHTPRLGCAWASTRVPRAPPQAAASMRGSERVGPLLTHR